MIHKVILKMSDKAVLLSSKLNNKIISAAQKLLFGKFLSLNSLLSILVQAHFGVWVNSYVQMFHCCSNHRITVTTVGYHPGEVKVYDSLYDDVDTATMNKLEKTFHCNLQYTVPSLQGVKDCDLFAIAFARL